MEYSKPTLIKRTEKKHNGWYALYQCPFCENVFESKIRNVTRGDKKSCGCMTNKLKSIGQTKHGMYKEKIYKVFFGMKDRCENSNNPKYKNYGARGITLDFTSFEEFYSWALENGYQDGLTIERIDVNKGYSKENCTFITQSEQCLNKTNTKAITYKGITKCLAEWAEYLGIGRNTIEGRLKRNWGIEKAFETPVNENYIRNFKAKAEVV